MTVKRILAVLACSFATHAAQADVMYSWQQTQGHPDMRRNFYLDLVFSDAAVAEGQLGLRIYRSRASLYCQPITPSACNASEPRLLSMRFGYIAGNGARGESLSYQAGIFPERLDEMDMSFHFLPGGFLGGYIWAVDWMGQYFSLTSAGNLFTVQGMGAESGYCDHFLPSCYGSQGVIRQVPAGQVPEPASWLVFGAGALAAWSARCQRSRVQPAGASAA